jgi:outer membrane murein-binding lipoprotein Lpp
VTKQTQVRPRQQTVVIAATLIGPLLVAGCQSHQHRAQARTGQTATVPTVAAAATTSRGATTTTARAAGTPQCAFYGVTVALALLLQHDQQLPPIAKLRPAWAELDAEAHNANRLFTPPPASLRPVAPGYRLLLGSIDSAAAALQRGDIQAFRGLLNHSSKNLKSLSVSAKRAHLKCTVRSADGSTLTFGG